MVFIFSPKHSRVLLNHESNMVRIYKKIKDVTLQKYIIVVYIIDWEKEDKKT